MPRDDAPPDLVALADARASARRTHDWATADALKARIEAAGWKVIDSGTMYDLERAGPPDVEQGGTVRYGTSASVPSRLEESPVGVATIVLVADAGRGDAARTVGALAAHAPDGTRIVVVANGVPDDEAVILAALDAADPGAPGVVTEVVRTAARLGWAAALNAGIRRSTAPVVILVGPGVEPLGDLVSPLVAALEDERVAVAGPFGLVSDDLQRFDPAPVNAVDVAAIAGSAIAFRRSDYVERGPLDEHFVDAASLDAWWSLVLRDQPEDADDDAVPRMAVQVSSVPVRRHAIAAATEPPEPERDRLARKNRYRLLKRFATRRDLLVAGDRETESPVAERPERPAAFRRQRP